MRKNGFTLIELLAVIVILAIIALIATPIILGIINDAREESNERSIELYASAVRNGIAAYQLREGKQVLPGTYNESNPLPFEVEYDGKVDCASIIISEAGKVSLEGCTVNNGTKEYSYGTKPENENADIVCKAITIAQEGQYTYGDEYICDPGDGIERTFYVLEDGDDTTLTKTDGTPHDVGDKIGTASTGEVSLIMDSNIASDGTFTTTETIEWCTWEDYITAAGTCPDENKPYGDDYCEEIVYTSYGPVTAINYLKNATHNWNIEVYLPTYDQIYIINNSINVSISTTPWLFANAPQGTYFWTSTGASASYNTYVYAVINDYPSYGEGRLEAGFDSINENGVRPVITLPKTQLQ